MNRLLTLALVTGLACAACGKQEQDTGKTGAPAQQPAKTNPADRLVGTWTGGQDAAMVQAMVEEALAEMTLPAEAKEQMKKTITEQIESVKFEITFTKDKLFMVFDKGEESKTETYSYVVKSSKGNEVELEGTDESGEVLKGKAEFKGDSLILTRQDMPGSLVLKKK